MEEISISAFGFLCAQVTNCAMIRLEELRAAHILEEFFGVTRAYVECFLFTNPFCQGIKDYEVS